MSDPAVEAAQRALAKFSGTNMYPRSLAPIAAREALKLVRELHRPSGDECACCIDCLECGQLWPCDTARVAYTSEELER
ncbi:hypothetical protein SEA_MARSHA_65 [Mycobacterium phage Marsha]|nr:hypothetical protein SEA_MARSHA_65 [Mycobacterium phage Marsha]